MKICENKNHKYGENGFKHKPRFGLIIELPDEETQQIEYEKLSNLGYKIKVVVV